MTRIDFHSNPADALEYACRLVKKAYFSGHQVVVISDDRAQIDALDEALWQLGAGDFLPHCKLDEPIASLTPIVLASGEGDLPHYDVMINLGASQPPLFSRCQRLIEVVGRDAPAVAAGRARWAFYKDRGYPLTHHDAGKGAGS